MSDTHKLAISELNEAIRRRELSCREITEAFLQRIQAFDSGTKAFLTVEKENALREAEEVDRGLQSGELEIGPLTGIPIAIKDVIATQGLRTTCASRILENFIPPYDATVVARLKRTGAVILGKTNCDEFAMGSSTENSAFFPSRNPWDLARVPGGSSGGSAASVAAMEAPGALGTDTGGSVRQPAAFCGIVGLKPTYGRVSRYGLVAFASSLDQIGPMAQTTRDAAAILQVIAGPDPKDSTCSSRPVENYLAQLGQDIRGLKIGIPREWFEFGLDPGIEQTVRSAIKTLAGLGCSVTEVTLPHTQYAIATYYIIAPAEASSNLARYDGVKYGRRNGANGDLETLYQRTRSAGFGEEVKRRIMIGTYVLSSGYYDAYYLKASKVRKLLAEDYAKAFQQVDILAGPTTPWLPFKLGEKIADPLEMYLADIYTATGNLAGIPGLSMPCGFTDSGLPVGLQLQASHFEEGKLLRLAHALEQELSVRRPELKLSEKGRERGREGEG
ncbi:MAG: Asp-tRNA(Asn)/Glu-tRNA(Gln) amidotransferase subunit GatA [Acidobacteriota bacterium]